MKSLLLAALLMSSSAFAGTLTIGHKAQDVSPVIKNYVEAVLNNKCAGAFEEDATVTLEEVSYIILDQGMEKEYTAKVKVVSDYGHIVDSIKIEFDEDVYHGQGFYLYNISASAPYLCE
ncbi:hypothetical protein HBN50_14835 [Halobacteriovorax sp. GB3]|uniref:hypothetical protein n=1 Tax=Halobacteriovorax sp. GB3 TaxID=2719615 RepID=UPI002360487C|nr:hypothetical protein [Halobacteriovorax sp. GB3]MDD0854386.1 hypothetical protein [Halobacteriovorax sp. GB3]